MTSSVPRRRVSRVITAVLISLALAFGTLGFTAAPADAARKSVATNAEFKKIKSGQTLSQVRAIVDSQGTNLGGGLYRWKSTNRRHVFVEFDGGEVVFKQRLVTASLSEYKKIDRRDSYDRVKKIIGGPSLFSFQDNDVRYRIWPSPDLRDTVILKFDKGRVIGKERSSDFFGTFAGR